MWRLWARQVARYSRRLDAKNKFNAGLEESRVWSSRSNASAAAVFRSAAGSKTELGLARSWELHSSALPCSNPAALPYEATNPLLESVTALDVALHSAVHLPWLANQWWWMQWLSDSRKKLDSTNKFGSSYHSSFQNSLGVKNYGSAAAVEIVEEPPTEELDPDNAKKEKIEKAKLERQRLSKLYTRQRKIESEAWANAAAEYKELLMEMCRKNLAPNLPYVQSLALGWFEPFKKAIEAEQYGVETLEYKEHRAGYGPYLTQLPADMLAVITMHKLMGLLMGDLKGGGCVKVISVASNIGEAVETEVGIYKLMKKQGKKKKKKKKNSKTAKELEGNQLDGATTMKEIEEGPKELKGKLQLKVKNLIKRQKLRVARTIVRHANGDEPWNADIRVKVGSILIELLLDSAFIRAPASQTGDDDEELRPAFRHTMRNFTTGVSSVARQFGVLECDPCIFEQLHKSARFMVMPYMPMLVPPNRWRQFNHGAHLILPCSVMRIHGSQDQKHMIEKAGPSMQRVFKVSPLRLVGSLESSLGSLWRVVVGLACDYVGNSPGGISL